MARVKIYKVVDRLDTEFSKALEDTFKNFVPNQSFNRTELFRYFLRRVDSRCGTWEQVPDDAIEKE